MTDQKSLIGTQIDNYKIEDLLGSGGMASVYLASDVSLSRPVALKVLLTSLMENKDLRLRFHREAQATAQLHHPNIVQVYTTGTMPDGSPYIALQYIEGGSLSDHLLQLSAQGKWLSIIYSLSIARQMAEALKVAHEANIVHRDLKPSNILLQSDGTPVLSDLGIAAVEQATIQLTQTGGIVGTPNYMSPEQASSHVIDGRSDFYSLGVILYELLSGQLPFDADSPLAILHQHIYDQPTSLAQIRPDLTPQTIHIVETCLQKKPDDRYPDAQALIAALDDAIAAEKANPLITISAAEATIVEEAVLPYPGSGGQRPPQVPTANKNYDNRPWWPYALIAGVVLIALFAVLFFWQSGRSDETPTDVPTIEVVAAASVPVQPSEVPRATDTVEADPTVVMQATATLAVETIDDPIPIGTEFIVDGSKQINETGLFVYPGQTVTILYREGQWQAGPSPTWPLVGPEGDLQVLSKPSFPKPDAPIASLIAGLDFAPPNLIGQGTSFVAETAGSLWLAANDDGYDDNSGSMVVSIQIGPRPAETVVPRFSFEPIAYSCGLGDQNQIYLSDLLSGRQIPLPNQTSNSLVPAFSPDGNEISYRSNDSGTWQIIVSNLDGSNRRQVTSGPIDNYEAAWSPDGERFVFVSDRTGSKQIYVMDNDGTNQLQITNNDDYNDDPSWSVTGVIVYESSQDGRFNIYKLPPQGGDPLLIIDAGDASTTPSWSPDGKGIAFESREGESRHIWTATADGTNLQRITSEGTNNERPAWSPDGRWLAFHSNYQQASSNQFDIWAINIETRELIRLTHRGDCTNPAWGGAPTAAPPMREGIAACGLAIGTEVSAGANARLWNIPDATSGQALDAIPPGTLLKVSGGPIWGPIPRDIDTSGWWWQVERPSNDLAGWVWQARLLECEEP